MCRGLTIQYYRNNKPCCALVVVIARLGEAMKELRSFVDKIVVSKSRLTSQTFSYNSISTHLAHRL